MSRLASVSVDLDEVGCYAAIHGLEVPAAAAHAIYDFAVPRYRALFDALDVRATFFAIGADVPRNADLLRALADEGHEIANHPQRHLYDLTRQPKETMRDEVREAADTIEAATGRRPVGFRAPGYTITDALFEVLEEEGVRYDSSVFPCPAYYAAKTAAIGAYGALAKLGRGRESASLVDDPHVLRAPADPYRRGTPYWSRGDGITELPIGVTRGLRLPYIGTSVVMSETAAELLTRAVAGRPLVNLELHGIDQSDADEDGLEWLRPHQPDLRRSAHQKELALRAAIVELRRRGHDFVTLATAAEAST